jgi:hypothetical protein
VSLHLHAERENEKLEAGRRQGEIFVAHSFYSSLLSPG